VPPELAQCVFGRRCIVVAGASGGAAIDAAEEPVSGCNAHTTSPCPDMSGSTSYAAPCTRDPLHHDSHQPDSPIVPLRKARSII